MDLGSFIRGFFGLRHPKQDRCDECIKNPEYQWPEKSEVRENWSADDDARFHDGHFFDIVQPMDPSHIFQHVEDLFNNFFSFHSGRMLDFPSVEEPFNENKDDPRDFLLNPSERNFGVFWGGEHGHHGHFEFPNIESFNEPRSPRDLVLKPSYRDSPKVESTPHKDSDLDGACASEILQEFPQQSKPTWSFRKSVSTKIIRRSDGTVEEHRTERDSSGKEVTTVRKSIGDQSYGVTLHKDSDGVNEKIEDFVNLDEKNVPDFQERWRRIKENDGQIPKNYLLQEPDYVIRNPSGDEHYISIFKKLFRF